MQDHFLFTKTILHPKQQPFPQGENFAKSATKANMWTVLVCIKCLVLCASALVISGFNLYFLVRRLKIFQLVRLHPQFTNCSLQCLNSKRYNIFFCSNIGYCWQNKLQALTQSSLPLALQCLRSYSSLYPSTHLQVNEPLVLKHC